MTMMMIITNSCMLTMKSARQYNYAVHAYIIIIVILSDIVLTWSDQHLSTIYANINVYQLLIITNIFVVFFFYYLHNISSVTVGMVTPMKLYNLTMTTHCHVTPGLISTGTAVSQNWSSYTDTSTTLDRCRRVYALGQRSTSFEL